MGLYRIALQGVLSQSGFAGLTSGNLVMLAVAFVLLYLAIAKDFEPLLLMPIAFGCLLVNLPLSGIVAPGGFPGTAMGDADPGRAIGNQAVDRAGLDDEGVLALPHDRWRLGAVMLVVDLADDLLDDILDRDQTIGAAVLVDHQREMQS